MPNVNYSAGRDNAINILNFFPIFSQHCISKVNVIIAIITSRPIVIENNGILSVVM